MNSYRASRRLMAVVGGATLIGMAAVTAGCGGTGTQAPETPTPTTTTSPSSSAPASPTEKGISPTGGNLFTPPVHATPAPNVPPGQHPGINGIP